MGRPLGATAKALVEEFGPEHLLKPVTQRDLADLNDMMARTFRDEIAVLRDRVAELEDMATRP